MYLPQFRLRMLSVKAIRIFSAGTPLFKSPGLPVYLAKNYGNLAHRKHSYLKKNNQKPKKQEAQTQT